MLILIIFLQFNNGCLGYVGISVSSTLTVRPRKWVIFLAGSDSFLSPTASVVALEPNLSSGKGYQGLFTEDKTTVT